MSKKSRYQLSWWSGENKNMRQRLHHPFPALDDEAAITKAKDAWARIIRRDSSAKQPRLVRLISDIQWPRKDNAKPAK